MAVEVQIKGVEQIKDASARIRANGNSRVVRKELNTALRESAAPAVQHVKEAALALPAKSRRRVLRQRIADSTSAQVKSTGKEPSVKVRVSRVRMKDKALVPQLMDRGSFRHPVFNRETWVTQEGHPGWFERAIDRDVPSVRERVKTSAERIARTSIEP